MVVVLVFMQIHASKLLVYHSLPDSLLSTCFVVFCLFSFAFCNSSFFILCPMESENYSGCHDMELKVVVLPSLSV